MTGGSDRAPRRAASKWLLTQCWRLLGDPKGDKPALLLGLPDPVPVWARHLTGKKALRKSAKSVLELLRSEKLSEDGLTIKILSTGA